MNINKGDEVNWKWGRGQASGKVIEVQTNKTTKLIKGNAITKKGTDHNPVLVIEQDNGNHVLKLRSEVNKVKS